MLDWSHWLQGLGGVVPLHYGVLHTYEGWLVPILGIGPFVVMIVVIYFVRKRDSGDEEEEGEA